MKNKIGLLSDLETTHKTTVQEYNRVFEHLRNMFDIASMVTASMIKHAGQQENYLEWMEKWLEAKKYIEMLDKITCPIQDHGCTVYFDKLKEVKKT